MSFDDGTLHDLAGAYALDAIDEDERGIFETHLATCRVCQREVAGFRQAAAALGDLVEVDPPPELRAELLDRIASTPQVGTNGPGGDVAGPAPIPVTQPDPEQVEAPNSPSNGEVAPVIHLGDRVKPAAGRSAGGFGRIGLAAAAVIIVIGGAFTVLRSGSFGPDGATDDYAALLAESDVVVTGLDPLTAPGASEPGTITIAWSAATDRVGIQATDLADPPPGHAYALWLLPADGAPVPAGLFAPADGEFSSAHSVDDLASSGWGITIEPADGSDQPTSDILYAVSF